MDETLELISETQNKLKELMVGYSKKTKSVQKQNDDKIKELYEQIMEFIAETARPYRQFFRQGLSKYRIAIVSIKHSDYNDSSVYDLMANNDWTKFYFTNQYNTAPSYSSVVLDWKNVKKALLNSLEFDKEVALTDLEIARKKAFELKEKLDAFEL